MSSHVAGVGSDLPELDDHLVEPGTPYEMLDGELIHVPPCDDPHGEREVQLSALVAMHVAPGFCVAADLLTRTSKVDDIAPDVSIYGRDPETGKRQLQQLVFEVVSTQSPGYVARKAVKFAARGVRRMFMIDIVRSRALEWSATLGTWSLLDPTGHITDPTLAVPLPIDQMIRSAQIDDAIARALVAKNNRVIEEVRADGEAVGSAKGEAVGLAKGRAEGRAEGVAEGLAEGRAEGRAEGLAEGRAEGLAEGRAALAEAVVDFLMARGVVLDSADRDRILRERDSLRLKRWIVRAGACTAVAELFDEP